MKNFYVSIVGSKQLPDGTSDIIHIHMTATDESANDAKVRGFNHFKEKHPNGGVMGISVISESGEFS